MEDKNIIQTDGNGEVHLEIKKILERAITDSEFKGLLLHDPDQALADYELTEVQTLLLKSLDAGDLEKLTLENLEEYFAADAAVYTPDDAGELDGYEAYSMSDVERIS